jgi:YHS domain-containing protein/copper chaperone CopZ
MTTTTEMVDPVCGMTLESYDVAVLGEYEGQAYVFCSPVCRERFDRDPRRYAHPATPLDFARVAVAGRPCAGEVFRLERDLSRVDGIVRVAVNPATGEAYLTFDPNRLSLADVEAAVADTCAAFS